MCPPPPFPGGDTSSPAEPVPQCPWNGPRYACRSRVRSHSPSRHSGIAVDPKHRHSRSTLCAQTSPFLKCPLRTNTVIPEVPSAHKLRHSVRSRRIHLRLPTEPLEKPGSSALHYGYCDFAQYDGRWQGEGVPAAVPPSHRPRRPVPPSHRPRSRSRPPPAIPEVPSAHKLRHSARSRRIHLRLPTQPLEKPGSSALHYGYCDFAQYDGRWQGEGVPAAVPVPSPPPPRPPCHRPRSRPRPPPAIPEVPSAHKLRHSARSRRIHLRLPTEPLEKPGSSALHYGYCDFAQYDGRWQGEGVPVPRPAVPAARPVPVPPFPKCP